MNLDAVLNATMAVVMILLMLSMGLALTPADFKRVALMPVTVALGLAAQMILLPLAAFLVIRVFDAPTAVAIGILLVAICPSGGTSNFFSYISGGELALSVTLNATVTLLSLVTLPVIFSLTFLGANTGGVEIPTLYILKTMLLGLILPIALGMVIRAWRPAFAGQASNYTGKAGTGLVLLVLALMVFKNWAALLGSGGQLLAAVLALNLGGMAAGYGLAAVFKRGLAVQKTFAFEVGMQNIPLAVVLAMGLFASDPRQLSVILVVIAMYAVLSFASSLCCVYFFKRMPSPAPAAEAVETAA